MSAHEEVQVLQAELGEKLDALKSQGLDEADLQVATTNLIIEFGAKVQAATLAKAQATASTAASSTTIFAEQSEKTNLKSLSSEDLHSWGEKLKAKQVLTHRTGRHGSTTNVLDIRKAEDSDWKSFPLVPLSGRFRHPQRGKLAAMGQQ